MKLTSGSNSSKARKARGFQRITGYCGRHICRTVPVTGNHTYCVWCRNGWELPTKYGRQS